MSRVEEYLAAATRANTRRSYAAALRHFEIDWGGHLPATSDSVARYLADHAATLALNTLKHRLAALARWHTDHGFADPTGATRVRDVLKGIRALHPAQEKRASPLQLVHLGQVADALARAAEAAHVHGRRADALRHLRDRALVVLGFWRGFRSDELLRVRAEHVQVVPGQGLVCFLAQSKGDRQNTGRTYKVPALSRWCPVEAVTAWMAASGVTSGPLFRGIDRWAGVAPTPLHPNSLIRLLRRVFTETGLALPETYSSHSLRRGFAGWANDNGWDVKTLMEYVGWKDVQSALRYVDGAEGFQRARMEAGLPAPVAETSLTVRLPHVSARSPTG